METFQSSMVQGTNDCKAANEEIMKTEKNETQDSKDETDEYSPLKPDNSKEEPKHGEKEKISFMERLRIIKENTTVEPILACYYVPGLLVSFAVQNLNLEKACLVNLNYSSEVCDALYMRQTENYTEQETAVQTLIANTQIWKNVLQTFIPVLLILFVGAWSDKTGRRKPCILMPIIADLLTSLGFIINTYFFYELPVEVLAFTEAFLPAFTGGCFSVGVFSYIGDITTEENRTYRLGIVNICMTLGFPIGMALSGVMVQTVGFYGIFATSSTLYFFCIIYGYFYLDDQKRKPVQKCKGNPCINFLKEFFDVKLVLETFKVAFKNGPGNRRLRVALLLIVVCVVFGPMSGEFSIMYLFTRYRFNWDEVQFSMWSTYGIITNMIGTMFSMSFFSSYLKLDDTLLGIISCSSKVIAAFAYAFARNNLEIYLAPLLEILNGTSFIAMRSIATKLVNGEEFGKVNSLFGLAEATMPLVYGPLYSRVYLATLDVLPGAVFLLGALLTLPAIAIFMWLYFEHKKDAVREAAAKGAGEKA